MAENRRFYYLKLKEGFYNSETMVVLESMPDGLLYSNLLLKMYLMSLKSGGILMLNEHLPHTVQTIATFTRHQIGTVERAIKVFMEFGLVEVLTDGAFYMADIQLLIGQSSTEGERKKRERSRLQRQKLLPSGKVDICPPIDQVDKCPPILEIRDKEYRDKSLENREGEHARTLGRYQNVFLSAGELSELQADFPTVWQEYIERLSEYMASTGKRYQSHAATIRRWIADDRRKAQGLQDRYLYGYTFANDNGGNPVMTKAHTYVDHWPEAFKKNIDLLLFGDVGTGKSFAAGRIANALLDQDIPVLMTNFPTILARLCGTFGEDRTAFLDSLGDYNLLIIDDLYVERNTEYALEQMFSIIDSHYRCNKPLIVTTNLKLDELKHPPDLAHARIYERILERCAPVLFAGKNFRKDNAASTKAAARQIITSPTASHRQAVTEKGEL